MIQRKKGDVSLWRYEPVESQGFVFEVVFSKIEKIDFIKSKILRIVASQHCRIIEMRNHNSLKYSNFFSSNLRI